MVDKGLIDLVPSFLIESAVYNVPNGGFNAGNWTGRVENVLTHIFNGTKTDDCIASMDWLEVNRCKYLFAGGQSWSRETANAFALQAWRYVGFGS